MEPIVYVNRESQQKQTEQVFGKKALKLLYGNDLLSKIFGTPLLYLLTRLSLFSSLYGWWQKQPWTKKKITPFIQHFAIDATEFANDTFCSFNDFFIRKLKPAARPLAKSDFIIPADGRYWFYQNCTKASHFIIKGQKFDLTRLLQDEQLAAKYRQGAMVIARLGPTDYHRFHFPCAGTPGKYRLINGPLFSVNPIAIKYNLQILTQNKRCITPLQTEHFGTVQYIEIGATCVGSIHQTYVPNYPVKKGDEKGYFSFGASALILLFEQQRILLDNDLVQTSENGFELKCLLGQSLGQAQQILKDH